MRTNAILTAFAVALCASCAMAQDDGEQLIRRSLEGRQVVVKMDLPAVDSGLTFTLDDTNVSLDEPTYKGLLHDYGTAIRKDSRSRITGVRVTKRGIEIDLDGGGSPARDWMGGIFRVEAPVNLPKSQRELELERQLQLETNPAIQTYLRSEIDYEQRQRLTQDAKNQESYAQLTRMRSKYIEENRKDWGSKIIVLIRSRKPSVKMKDMVASLAKYIELLPREKTAQ